MQEGVKDTFQGLVSSNSAAMYSQQEANLEFKITAFGNIVANVLLLDLSKMTVSYEQLSSRLNVKVENGRKFWLRLA